MHIQDKESEKLYGQNLDRILREFSKPKENPVTYDTECDETLVLEGKSLSECCEIAVSITMNYLEKYDALVPRKSQKLTFAEMLNQYDVGVK